MKLTTVDGVLYQVNASIVVHETFADEVVAVSFADGSYYSIRGTGILIWKLLCAGASTDQIVTALQSAYPNEPGLRDAIIGFLNELLSHSLITAVEGSAASSMPTTFPDPAGFTPPVFEVYTDMQDLLLIDPIHEVGEDGWPRQVTAPSPLSANG